ncbi:MAG: Bax inhibitor-1/YccA family protein, partial [Isosphaeraceae bacterium]
ISNLFNQRYPGIATQAVGLTFGVLFVMLFLYGSRIIKVTQKLVVGIVAATGAVALLYIVTMVLSLFHIQVPFIFGAGPIGIGFSLFVVGLAAFNLLLDFDVIERGAATGAPKYMEWYGAFGLMVTLIWLYLEILRLLAKLQSRDR